MKPVQRALLMVLALLLVVAAGIGDAEARGGRRHGHHHHHHHHHHGSFFGFFGFYAPGWWVCGYPGCGYPSATLYVQEIPPGAAPPCSRYLVPDGSRWREAGFACRRADGRYDLFPDPPEAFRSAPPAG